MNNNDDFFAAMNQPTPDMSPDDELFEQKTPGSMREDASRWDKFTDAQRKLIVFGVLLAVLLVLALVIGIGSSCGDGCGSCALCASESTSDSDIADGPQPEENEPARLPETVSGSDEAAVSDSEPSDPADNAADAVSDSTVSDSELPALPAVDEEQQVISEGDAPLSGTDAGPVDNSAGTTEEYVEVVQPGGFSSCVHHADNEAGDQSENNSTGFLGFLFGCGGKGCSIDVNESLTDPVGDDPSRLEGMNPSGSDTDGHLWAAQPDDESYIELLRGQLAAISEQLFTLSELDLALSQHTDPQRVRENDRFRKVSDSMLEWCEAAESYDGSLLSGEQAHNCHLLSLHLASDLRTYLDSYPILITGATSGTDVISKDEQLNNIMGDIVELYAALNALPGQNAGGAEE